MYRILLVEDDRTLSNGIVMALTNEHIVVVACHTLNSARAFLETHQVQLVLLDINLPDGSGLQLLGKVKVPVILLTANDTELDVVNGLEQGADDYITKPFSLAVLRARVNAQLRRYEISPSSVYVQDGFRFNFEHMQFFKDSIAIELSKTEQKLLRCLVDNPGIVLERSMLVDRIWTDSAEYVDENALSVTIKRLRDKLESDPSHPRYIKTQYGIGYIWMGM